jgi:DNA-binding NtrC family response regulator
MRAFEGQLAQAAQHDVNVLLVGESGTGKTTFAPAVHDLSPRASRPFVRVDCPAGAGDLPARARAARRGTLFLDEVADLPPPAQATALRLLQEPGPRALRLVASSGRDLQAAVSAGRFRGDLYYQLDVVEIRIPPLRQRREDILPLARTFLVSLAREQRRPAPELSPELERILLRHPWPGNIPELRGVLQRILILSGGPRLEVDALPDRIRAT